MGLSKISNFNFFIKDQQMPKQSQHSIYSIVLFKHTKQGIQHKQKWGSHVHISTHSGIYGPHMV